MHWRHRAVFQLHPLRATIMSTISSTHIVVDEQGVAWIDDTNVKVIEVATEKIAHGSSPEEIFDQHQNHLSLAQIHAALSWYYDHQSDFDADIKRQVKEFDTLRSHSLDSPLRQRLRSAGELP
jgi:uncharacterized protein (DUF433 family)